MVENLKASSAADFLKNWGEPEVCKTLRSGLVIKLKKVDVMDILASDTAGLPVVNNEEDVKKLSKEEQEKILESGKIKIKKLVIASLVEPQIIEGTKSDPENNKIAWDDPAFPSVDKNEITGFVFEFNGYTEQAKKFFRATSL